MSFLKRIKEVFPEWHDNENHWVA